MSSDQEKPGFRLTRTLLRQIRFISYNVQNRLLSERPLFDGICSPTDPDSLGTSRRTLRALLFKMGDFGSALPKALPERKSLEKPHDIASQAAEFDLLRLLETMCAEGHAPENAWSAILELIQGKALVVEAPRQKLCPKPSNTPKSAAANCQPAELTEYEFVEGSSASTGVVLLKTTLAKLNAYYTNVESPNTVESRRSAEAMQAHEPSVEDWVTASEGVKIANSFELSIDLPGISKAAKAKSFKSRPAKGRGKTKLEVEVGSFVRWVKEKLRSRNRRDG